ncbi:hypothetical protein R5R35_011142 [Gryllus longicercus]|uniref:Proteasomal ubiquitin receptor ADRM1 homolog n=1 Tax=Gryllus longicercus TaxID=2509291 RepID=A0AAN9VJG8_9ORTH
MAVGAALFGNTSSRSQSKNLVECKAGKMTLKGKMVHPDKRKGLLYVYQSDDSLMHFCWKDRTTGTVEDDLIIFPDDCEFKRVTQCTTGRVYVLKFKSSSRKFFFWVQEPKTDKDEENCRRINEVLNNPPTPGSARSGGATPDSPVSRTLRNVLSADGGDLQNLLNNMSQQQLMQLFGGVGQIGGLSSLLGTMSRPSTSQSGRSGASASTTAATATTSSSTSSVASAGSTDTKTSTTAATTEPKTTSTTTATTTSTSAAAVTTTTVATSAPTTTTAAAPTSTSSGGQPAIQLSDLQNFLSGLSAPQPGGQGSGVDLAQAITTDNLSTVLVEPGLAEALQQHLPAVAAIAGSGAGQTASDQLRSTLSSPQFQQALSMFSAALQSGQLGPVMQQLEVGPEAVDAANQGNMEEFVRALQRASLGSQPDTPQSPTSGGGEEKRPKRDGDNSGKKPDEDDDEGMSMD